MPQVFVANCQPSNWKGCVEGLPLATPPPVFGIRKESFHPEIEAGDIFLIRVILNQDYSTYRPFVSRTISEYRRRGALPPANTSASE